MSCVCPTALAERDATFAVSSEDRVRVYSSSNVYLLHEFSTLHGRVVRMFHTTFCDAIVTLEADTDDCYLCVYHDWRGKKLVRAYTLPLAIADPAGVQLSVCSFTGRVVLGTPKGVNVWHTSNGFFEHVLELQVGIEVAQIAVHGAYLAVASATEVRVLEINITTNDDTAKQEGTPTSKNLFQKKELIYNTMEKDHLPVIRIPSLSHRSPTPLPSPTPRHRVRIMAKDDAQLEAHNLAGLIHDEDVRVNVAMQYGECKVRVLLQRFVPPNHAITSLKFLPETIDNGRIAQSQSYTRLLIETSYEAFLYYILADEVDKTRNQMAKKILHRLEDPLRGTVEPISITTGDQPSFTTSSSSLQPQSESGRIVIYYRFTAPVKCVTANSSFLFAATLAGLEIWSLWSPCHHNAAKRATSSLFLPQPTQPQLLGVRPLPTTAQDIIALDAHVVVLTCVAGTQHPRVLSNASAVAKLCAPLAPFEMRDLNRTNSSVGGGQVVVYPQSPPATIFASAKKETMSEVTSDQVDLLLSLFSLYRFRADVGVDMLQSPPDSWSVKDRMAVRLDTKLYDSLAKSCAAHIAHIYTTPKHRNLTRAALLFVASNVSSRDVLLCFRSIDPEHNISRDVIDATALYLEAFLFPKKDRTMYLGLSTSPIESEVDASFTEVVLRHYGVHAPEQIARLVIDSSLVWSLFNLDFCLSVFRASPQKSILIRMAILVVLLRANMGTREELASFVETKSTLVEGTNKEEYAYSTIANQIEWLAENYPEPLVHLCVTHPEFLIQTHPTSLDDIAITPGYYRSYFADGLRERSPVKLLLAQELIFTSAIGHQNPLTTIITYCVGVMGEQGSLAVRRILGEKTPRPKGCKVDDVFVVGILHFIILYLKKNDNLFPEVQPLHKAISAEYICTLVQLNDSEMQQSLITTTLAHRSVLLPKKISSPLPPFVASFLNLTTFENPHIQQTMHQLYLLACHLVLENWVDAPTLLTALDDFDNTIAVLLKLLLFPQVQRLGDGLSLLNGLDQYRVFLLPYAVSFCKNLEEWQLLLDIILSPQAGSEMEFILAETLVHLSRSVSPDELLALVPDDVDASIVLDALEMCVRRQEPVM
ncbi:hypothetical protein THRCLA_02518 [Thraustotheca clavata]|uniref:BLOC-2 complex member HPS3 N-terminal domain-containing protein n=1 Tax=Thraustotheca clavata TaxID=74557 RepID=A0A1W0A4X0_9STRA|nr:hypothetical protein THRCLA_02518 [Thraustotheca clavata]